MIKGLVVGICGAVEMFGPAGVAHADPAQPTDYSTEIVGVEPVTPSIAVGVIGGDSFIELTVERVVSTPEVTHIRYAVGDRTLLVLDDRGSGDTPSPG